MTGRSCRFHSSLAVGQGALYAAVGLWPLLHPRSFERAIGRRRDRWLARVAGLVLANVGGALLAAGLRKRVPGELKVLALGSALSLAGADLAFGRGASPIRALDAVAQLGFVAGWALAELADQRAVTRAPLFASAAVAAAA
jgi:hypothetical protein